MNVISPFYQRNLATASFAAAVLLAFTSMALTPDHDIAAGACMVIAQFLLLTASILGIDYKINKVSKPNGKQKNQ